MVSVKKIFFRSNVRRIGDCLPFKSPFYQWHRRFNLSRDTSPLKGLFMVVLLLHRTYAFSPPVVSRSSHTQLMGVRGFRSWFESQFPKSVHEISKESSNESFDHVLVDANSLLHICIRKSRTDGHALVLFMKELDAIVALATPSQSLVLALDGPPGAAKLATQRKRRYQTVVRSQIKSKQIESFLSVEKTQTRKAKTRIRKLKRKKDRMQRDLKTLRLTPATDFMEKAVQAMEYWAWQRLESRRSVLSHNNVTVFISPSTASGEGEIKLMEWLNHKPRRGESVAIIGGDSDLVLESFLVPLSSTHNVFVLLPDGNKRILVVSVWEATRKLAHLTQCTDFASLIRVRTDFALMMILNGNDYLPKLRACSTFNRLYYTYIKLRQTGAAGYLVDPTTLEINVDVAIQYFEELAKCEQAVSITRSEDRTVTPMLLVNNLVSSHLLPSPIKFLIDGDEREESEDDSDDSDSSDDDVEADDDFDLESDTDVERHQIILGDPDSEDFLAYETWVPKNTRGKDTRQTLAAMVLSDLQDGDPSEEEEEDFDLSMFTTEPVGYDWEVKEKLPSNVGEYLYGLLWNLQTYQDGVCADYGYNYGKRSAPAPSEILSYLKNVKQEGAKLVPEYFHEPSALPMPAGLSSMAALPSFLSDLITYPYNNIGEEKTEQLFAECMSPIDNVFDAHKFEKICRNELASLGLDAPKFTAHDHHWKTVAKAGRPLSKKTIPPEKFSERMVRLRPSNRIRRGQVAAAFGPRSRQQANLATPGPFLSNFERVESLEYRLAFRKTKERRFRQENAADSKGTKSAESKGTKSEPTVDLLKDQIDTSLFQPKYPSSVKTRYIEGLVPDSILKNNESNSAVGVLTNLTGGTSFKIKVRFLRRRQSFYSLS